MVATSFSALMPSVLRLVNTDEFLGVHLTAETTTPLADWGKCFRTEDEVERVLQVLEPLLVLLSVAGYGVPEVAMAAVNAAQADVVSVSMPALELRRGTAQAWTAAPGAQVGLRVCPTTANPLDLSAKLATYKPGFGIKACGWLMLPASESDPVTSLDDLVRNKLWPALVSTVAAANAEVGVAALINHAAGYQIVSDVPVGASLSDLVANARLKLNASGASGVLEAEFDAQDGGPTLGEQMQVLAGNAGSLLTRVVTRGLVATTAEVLWDYWHDDESADDLADAPSTQAVDSLGFVRAVLSWVGTTDVVDAKPGQPAEPLPLADTPLANLMRYRSTPEEARKVPAAELPFVKRATDLAIAVRLASHSYTRDPSWRDFAHKTDPYPLLPSPAPMVPAHTLDFARYWFDLGDNETRYVIEEAEITSYIDGDPTVLAMVNQRIGTSKRKKPSVFKELLAEGEPTVKACWCSGLTLLTLGAAGYDLESPLTGKNGKAHAYVDANGWQPIRPMMLIDGQKEATAAMGLVLTLCPGGDLKSVNGLTVYLTGDTATIRDHSLVGVEPVPGKIPLATEGDVFKEGLAYVKDGAGAPNGHADAQFFQTETYGLATSTSIDYDDSAAVRYGPGAIELMGIGRRVSVARIRPGDIGQLAVPMKTKSGSQYIGLGHAFQVWAVRVRGPYDRDLPNPGTLVGDGAADANGHLLFEVDAGTSTSQALDDEATVVAYRVIEANVSGSTQGLASSTDEGNGGVSISKWIEFPPPPASSGGPIPRFVEATRYYFGRLHESPWSDFNLKRSGVNPTPAPAPTPDPAPTPGPAPAPEPGSGTGNAPAFDAAAASAHIDTLTAAYRNISAGGLTFKTKYRNAFLADHGGPYVAANYGGEEEADAFKNNYATYMAAMGKGSPEGVQKGVQASFDAGRIHADPEVNKEVGAELTVDDLEKYCHGLYGVDCIGFVLQALLTFPDYASYMPAHIVAKYPQPMSEKLSHFRRLAETNTADFEAASDELADPKTWRPLDVITWGGSGGSGHVILIRSTSLLASGIWEVQCAESVGGKWEVNGPKTSTYFYAPTANAAGLHWATSEADAIAGSMYGVILARATVRRAKMGAVA